MSRVSVHDPPRPVRSTDLLVFLRIDERTRLVGSQPARIRSTIVRRLSAGSPRRVLNIASTLPEDATSVSTEPGQFLSHANEEGLDLSQAFFVRVGGARYFLRAARKAAAVGMAGGGAIVGTLGRDAMPATETMGSAGKLGIEPAKAWPTVATTRAAETKATRMGNSCDLVA